jgi:hypothetical protein
LKFTLFESGISNQKSTHVPAQHIKCFQTNWFIFIQTICIYIYIYAYIDIDIDIDIHINWYISWNRSNRKLCL